MTYEVTSQESLTDPIAWLDQVEADAAASDTVDGAAALVGEVPPRMARLMAGPDPAWGFAGEGVAQATAQRVGNICANKCEINDRCIEARCPFWRLEQAAEAYLEGESEWLP